MAKNKKVVLSVIPQPYERGALGKDFYLSTYRFPLKEAQGFERRAKSLGVSMAGLLQQLVESFNKAMPAPAGVKTERTSKPTVWGEGKRPKSVNPSAKKAKVTKKDDPKPVAQKPKASKALSSAEKLKAKLRAMKRQSEAA
jgi:hypothetical protein